ncbi:MAG: MBL fold metallo-hydrolase, partial [Desulfobacterales bacterium]
MVNISFLLLLFIMTFTFSADAMEPLETDIIKTSDGDLKITFIGHGTLMFAFNQQIIHVDPFSKVADYAKLTKADVILITHEHFDHLDLKALEQIRTEKTKV